MPLLIAHLSDTHIVAPPALCYGTVDTVACLARAVSRLNRMSPRPDLVLLTGDLVDEPTVAAYACLRSLLSQLELPTVLLPGNHDDRALLSAALPEHTYLPTEGAKAHFVRAYGELRLIAWDAVVAGREHASVERADLDWLDAVLSAEPARPTLLAMHHPPMPTGLAYMDAMQPPLPDALESVISRHRQLQLIVAGHIHRAMDGTFGGVRVATAPSTAHQFQLAVDPHAPPRMVMEPPQIRLHFWSDVSMTSFAVPVDDSAPTADFPGVDEARWPAIVRRMREGDSRSAVLRDDEGLS